MGGEAARTNPQFIEMIGTCVDYSAMMALAQTFSTVICTACGAMLQSPSAFNRSDEQKGAR